jgi:sulfur relay (sulfurtransferase) DsrF/TusC family protein
MGKFDNIKCIDLREYSIEELKKIGDYLEFNVVNQEALCLNKQNGISKLWIDKLNNHNVIAYTVGDDPEIIIADNFIVSLQNFKTTTFDIEKIKAIVSSLESIKIHKENIKNLQELLENAILEENYLKAADLKNELNKIK